MPTTSPEPREFHISDVLTVSTGLLLSTRHMEGVYDILNFLTQDELFTHALPRAAGESRPWLIRQHPLLDSPEMNFAVAELKEMLKTTTGRATPDHLIRGWLSKLTCGKYGFACPETLLLRPIPQEEHEIRDPIEELREMAPHAEIVVIENEEEEEWKRGVSG